TVSQGHVDGQPGFSFGGVDATIVVVRPSSSSSVMGIRPLQDLGDRVFGQRFTVPLAAMLGQEPGQRLAAMKSTLSHAQRLVDVSPLFVSRFPDATTVLVRPVTRARMVGVGPREDLLDGEVGAPHRRLFSIKCGPTSRSLR